MALIRFANNAQTTLAAPITNLATSVNLVPGTGALFPTLTGGDAFIATLIDAATGLVREIVQVTAIAGDVATLLRAQEGTIAQSWLAGDSFQNLWTAGQAALMAQAAQFTTGDVKPTFKTAPDATWVMMNDGSIGNATSNATNRANADTFNLYSLIWSNVANVDAPIQNSAGVPTGTRGASALADFNASNRLVLPKALGRAFGAAGAGAGLTNRNLGSAAGAESNTFSISQANLPNVNFPVTDPTHAHFVGSAVGGQFTGSGGFIAPGSVVQTTFNGTGISVNSGGSGTAVTVPTLTPSTFVNWMAKL